MNFLHKLIHCQANGGAEVVECLLEYVQGFFTIGFELFFFCTYLAVF